MGRTIRLLEEAPGEPPSHRMIRFIRADADGADQEVATTDADGHPTGDPVRRRSSWLDLQAHASQPEADTVITEVDLSLAFGTLPCWLYTVSVNGGERRFWFAKALPGMPVLVEEWDRDRLVGRTEMIDNQPALPLSSTRGGI